MQTGPTINQTYTGADIGNLLVSTYQLNRLTAYAVNASGTNYSAVHAYLTQATTVTSVVSSLGTAPTIYSLKLGTGGQLNIDKAFYNLTISNGGILATDTTSGNTISGPGKVTLAPNRASSTPPAR